MSRGHPKEAYDGILGLLFPAYAVQLTLEQNGFELCKST